MTTPLVTLDEVKAFMAVRGDIEMPAVDSRLEMLVMLATEQLETALNVEFTYGARVQYFNSARARRYQYDWSASASEYGLVSDPLPQTHLLLAPPVDLAQPVVVMYDPLGEWGPATVVDPRAYSLEETRGRLTVRLMSIARERANQVQYTGGYLVDTETATLTNSAPTDIKTACIIQTIYLFTRLQTDNIGHGEEVSGGKLKASPYLTRGGITPEAATLLWRYKRINMGRY